MSTKSDDVISFVKTLLVKNYPKAWQSLWEDVYDVSHYSNININSALEVFRLVYGCLSKEEEGRPISTGFFMGDRRVLLSALPDSSGLVIGRKSISECSGDLRHLFGIIDGKVSVFIIGADGNVEGASLLPEAKSKDGSCNASCDFSVHCASLNDVNGFGLIALGEIKTAKLFFGGNLHTEVYFSGKTGDWAYRSIDEIRERLKPLISQKGIDEEAVNRIVNVAIKMSNHRKGGTIVIGDAENVLRQSEEPRHWLENTNIKDLKGFKENHLYNLATQEFALVIKNNGELRASSVRFLPKVPANMKIDVTQSDGGRHRSAAEISACADCIAFVVSDDGPLSVFSDGKRIVRL